MSKSIHTLVKDIYEVIDTGGGWDATLSKWLAGELQGVFDRRLSEAREQHSPSLRMSQLGTPCQRKLWYSINEPSEGGALAPSTKLKFMYGDILEQLLIALAIAAGHKVEGVQDRLEIAGVVGHRDCVIDGITVDVKSASSYAFKKFASGGLRDDDPFGYISQLSSYVYAGRDSDVESHPSLGAFLVVDKQNGTLCLDMYDFGPEINTKLSDVENIKAIVNSPDLPPRGFTDEPEGKSGNMKLCVQCSYCDMKEKCWPGLRTFLSSKGPVFLTKVKREPKMREA